MSPSFSYTKTVSHSEVTRNAKLTTVTRTIAAATTAFARRWRRTRPAGPDPERVERYLNSGRLHNIRG